MHEDLFFQRAQNCDKAGKPVALMAMDGEAAFHRRTSHCDFSCIQKVTDFSGLAAALVRLAFISWPLANAPRLLLPQEEEEQRTEAENRARGCATVCSLCVICIVFTQASLRGVALSNHQATDWNPSRRGREGAEQLPSHDCGRRLRVSIGRDRLRFSKGRQRGEPPHT